MLAEPLCEVKRPELSSRPELRHGHLRPDPRSHLRYGRVRIHTEIEDGYARGVGATGSCATRNRLHAGCGDCQWPVERPVVKFPHLAMPTYSGAEERLIALDAERPFLCRETHALQKRPHAVHESGEARTRPSLKQSQSGSPLVVDDGRGTRPLPDTRSQTKGQRVSEMNLGRRSVERLEAHG